MTQFECVKRMDVDEMARFLTEVREETIKNAVNVVMGLPYELPKEYREKIFDSFKEFLERDAGNFTVERSAGNG